MFCKEKEQKGNLSRGLLLSGSDQASEDSEVSQRSFINFSNPWSCFLCLLLLLFSKMFLFLLLSFSVSNYFDINYIQMTIIYKIYLFTTITQAFIILEPCVYVFRATLLDVMTCYICIAWDISLWLICNLV